MRPRFQGKCMTDMLLSVMIYDLCCSKTQPWTIFELGDDRMSFRELIIASWWAFYFNEVPVKVQISCNLEPCCLKKLIIKSARLHAWGSHSHAGRWNRKFFWSDLKSMSKHIHTLNKVIKNYIEQGKKVKKTAKDAHESSKFWYRFDIENWESYGWLFTCLASTCRAKYSRCWRSSTRNPYRLLRLSQLFLQRSVQSRQHFRAHAVLF